MYFTRVKKLKVHAEIIKMLLTSGEKHFKVTEKALPDGIQVIDIIKDIGSFPTFWFLLYSEEWPELEEGDEIPEIESPIFHNLLFKELEEKDNA